MSRIDHPSYRFLHVPRCGGTVLTEMLMNLSADRSIDASGRSHRGFDDWDTWNNKLEAKPVFGGIRNPYTWYPSLWEILSKDTTNSPDNFISRYFPGGAESLRKLNPIESCRKMIELLLSGKNLDVMTSDPVLDFYEYDPVYYYPLISSLDIGLLTFEVIRIYWAPYKDLWSLDNIQDVKDVYGHRYKVTHLYQQENIAQASKDILKIANPEISSEEGPNFLRLHSLNRRSNSYWSKEKLEQLYTPELKELVSHKERFIFNNFNYKVDR